MDKEKESTLEKIREIKFKKRFKIIIISLIIVVVILLIGYLVAYQMDKNNQTFDGAIAKQSSKVKNAELGSKQEEKERKKAVKVAIKQFKELGEKEVKEDALEVLKIQRKGELYYYISSKENTVEVRIQDNHISRINSVPVEE